MKQLAVNPVKPVLMNPEAYPYQLTQKNYDNMPQNGVGYYAYDLSVELPAIMVNPTFMVNEKVKRVIELYDESVSFKTLTLIPNVEEEVVQASISYAIPKLKQYDCLHEESIVMPEGTIKKLIIDRKKIPNVDIFQIKNTIQNKILVSLRMAESISRRNVFGVEFERVQLR